VNEEGPRRRDGVERVLDLAEHLEPSDRALLSAIYERGMTATAFAEAAGQKARTVRYRVRKLLDRVSSPGYRAIVAQREAWPRERQRVAEAVFLAGRTQRDAAKRLGMSLHQVRTEIERIRGLIEANGVTNGEVAG